MFEKGICFGAFDPLHIGHVFLFQRAKGRCKQLVVAVSNEERILKIKGYRPKFGLAERISALQELKCIDEIVIQELDNKRELVTKLDIDVIFVGSDWKGKPWDGKDLGIPIVYLPRTPNVSGVKLR